MYKTVSQKLPILAAEFSCAANHLLFIKEFGKRHDILGSSLSPYMSKSESFISSRTGVKYIGTDTSIDAILAALIKGGEAQAKYKRELKSKTVKIVDESKPIQDTSLDDIMVELQLCKKCISRLAVTMNTMAVEMDVKIPE